VEDAISTTTVVATDFVSEREFEVELDWGGNVTIEVAIGAVTTLSDPDTQIGSDCALSDLPAVGTSFQRIKVTMTSNSTRDIMHPKVLLGSLGTTENSTRPEGEFFTIGPADDRTILYGGTPAVIDCLPKGDVDFLQGPSDIGFYQEFMTPGEIESFQTVLTVKPGAPADWRWALLVTQREDENQFYGIVNPDGLSPGAFIVGLHNFGNEVLPDLEPTYASENLVKQICDALLRLKVAAEEPPNSENLKTLSRWYELNDSDLGQYVNATIKNYEKYPKSTSSPFSLIFAKDRCKELGN